MKKFLAIAVVLTFGITMFGCGKKQEVVQEPMTMEALNTMNAPVATTPETVKAAAPAETQVASTAVSPAPAVATPPSGPYRPSATEIQTALSNAGYYTGKIDGKIGPKSKKAIEEFQKANGLAVDGKVGPKTWAELSKYLTATATGTAQSQ